MNVKESPRRASEPARLALLLAAVLVAGCGSTAPSSPLRSVGPTASATPTAAGTGTTAAPTPTASATPSVASDDPFLGQVVITVSDSLRVRSEPRVSDDSLRYEPLLPLGTELKVIGGPTSGSGYTWYEVEPISLALRDRPGSGWVAAAAKDGEPWIALRGAPSHTPVPATPRPSPAIPQDASLDAALARCPTPDEIALVDSIVSLTFDADPTGPALVCRKADGSADLTRFQERTYQAVLSMRRIPFDAPLPWTDRLLFDWFADVVNGITIRETEGSYCCDGPGVLVISSRISVQESNLWIARDGNDHGLMVYVQLLIHEARHVEGFGHTCATEGDDKTLEEVGSWAVVYWFFTWLAEHAGSAYMTPVDGPADYYIARARYQADYTLQYRIGCAA